MKLNQPGLLAGASVLPHVHGGTVDVRPIATIRSVVDFVCSESLTMEQAGLNEPGLAACGGFAAYYASLILISHGDGVLQDSEWLLKVESLKKAIESVGRRWTVGGE